MADGREFSLVTWATKREIAREFRDWEQFKASEEQYQKELANYKRAVPSLAARFETEYWRL